jgi:hypothetical protein
MNWNALRTIGRWPTVVAFILNLITGACAAHGPAYEPAASPPSGKALVYFYWGDYGYDVLGSKLSAWISVERPDAPASQIAAIGYRGYVPFYTEPGELTFSWSGMSINTASLTINVQGGETFFIRGWVKAGSILSSQFPLGNAYRARLQIVDESTGRQEIVVCNKEN